MRAIVEASGAAFVSNPPSPASAGREPRRANGARTRRARYPRDVGWFNLARAGPLDKPPRQA